jgi:predicted TIM-barrel fold metal-dependent hydrolase
MKIQPVGAVDAWINPNLGEDLAEERDVDYLFPHLNGLKKRGTSLAQLLEEMEIAGVDRGVLCAGYGDVDDIPWVNKAIETYPEKFVGSIVIDPRKGMVGVRQIQSLVVDHGYKLVRLLAFDTQIPYDHAACFPIYAKCVELGVPVGVNVGIPGPKLPGRVQDPISLDSVCYFFPELKIIMSHGGDPWAALCVKLMLKWENLYYMSSAFAPKYIPSEIIKYMNSRGDGKIMWASDYPLLTLDRCTSEINVMDFKSQGHYENFVRNVSNRLFFS